MSLVRKPDINGPMNYGYIDRMPEEVLMVASGPTVIRSSFTGLRFLKACGRDQKTNQSRRSIVSAVLRDASNMGPLAIPT